jgi:hypothetical protein
MKRFRCEWKKCWQGVYVETHCTSAEVPDPKYVWHETETEARKAEAARMRRLAHHLFSEADSLTRDRRGD